MGGIISSEDPIDLLPPRFEPKPHPVTRLYDSPFQYMFGAEKRRQLLNSYYSPHGGVDFKISLRPDIDEKVDVSLLASTDDKLHVTGANASLGYVESESDPLWHARISGNTDGALRSTFSTFNPTTGCGAYASFPLDSLMLVQNPDSQLRGSNASELVSDVNKNSPGTDEMTRSTFGAISSTQRTSTQLGARIINPTQSLAAGFHLSPFNVVPARAWMVGNYKNALTFGAQLHTELNRSATRQSNQMRGGQSAFETPGSHESTQSSTLGISPALVALDWGVSYAQPPIFEMSVAVDGIKQELVAGYIHQMTVRRKVLNVLEKAHVKGIYNYVDLGFELRRSIRPPYVSHVSLGATWQLNKNLLLKAKVGTKESAASCAIKAWWDPAVTCALTAGYDRGSGRPKLGMFWAIEKGGEPEYRKAVRGYQHTAQHRAVHAREQVTQRISRRVDPDPFQDIPTTQS